MPTGRIFDPETVSTEPQYVNGTQVKDSYVNGEFFGRVIELKPSCGLEDLSNALASAKEALEKMGILDRVHAVSKTGTIEFHVNSWKSANSPVKIRFTGVSAIR